MAVKMQTRFKELGRIRLGDKDERGLPVKLSTFRLTSPNQALLECAAIHWGGTVKEWPGAPTEGKQWELVTETDELQVFIPFQKIAETQFYELWSKGGCQRRCDGEKEFKSGEPCLCNKEESRLCKLSTHVDFLLPQIPDIGTWRLSSTGYNAGQELVSTIELLFQLNQGKPPKAILALEARTSKTDGKTHQFVVPTIRTEETLMQLMESGPSTGALPTGETPALAKEEAPAEGPGETSTANQLNAATKHVPLDIKQKRSRAWVSLQQDFGYDEETAKVFLQEFCSVNGFLEMEEDQLDDLLRRCGRNNSKEELEASFEPDLEKAFDEASPGGNEPTLID